MVFKAITTFAFGMVLGCVSTTTGYICKSPGITQTQRTPFAVDHTEAPATAVFFSMRPYRCYRYSHPQLPLLAATSSTDNKDLAPEEIVIQGIDAPCYVTHFNKDGSPEDLIRLNRLIEIIQLGGYTDVYTFSHGWNTDKNDAIELYTKWITGYMKLRTSLREKIGDESSMNFHSKPLFIGITWPSKWAVLSDIWSGGSTKNLRITDTRYYEDPTIDTPVEEFSLEAKDTLINELADDYVNSQDRAEFLELCSQTSELSNQDRERLLKLLLPLFASSDDVQPPTPLASRGLLGGISLGDLWLYGSFWQMRDRAGIVGRNGVHQLLVGILQGSKPIRLHLIGHSFGAKVLLSAVSSEKLSWPKQKVTSMLLLQPAIVNRVFDSTGTFRKVLGRTESPVLSTFTKRDGPLRGVFHWAVEASRIGNWGRPQPERYQLMAADRQRDPDLPPTDSTSALGGYPPTELTDQEFRVVDPVKKIGDVYDFGSYAVCAMRMHEEISGHTEIANDHTYYLLYSLVHRNIT